MTLNNFETGSKSTLVCNFIVVAQTMEAWAKDAIENLILLNRQETYKSVGKFVNLTKLRNVMVLGISRSTALVSRLSTFSKLCQTFTPLKQTKNKSNQTAKTKYQKLCSKKKTGSRHVDSPAIKLVAALLFVASCAVAVVIITEPGYTFWLHTLRCIGHSSAGQGSSMLHRPLLIHTQITIDTDWPKTNGVIMSVWVHELE